MTRFFFTRVPGSLLSCFRVFVLCCFLVPLLWSVQESEVVIPAEVVSSEISGANALTEAERQELNSKLKGVITRQDWVERLQKDATSFLHDQGFLSATVSIKKLADTNKNGRRRITIGARIKEGPRYRVSQVWWTGNSSLTL